MHPLPCFSLNFSFCCKSHTNSKVEYSQQLQMGAEELPLQCELIHIALNVYRGSSRHKVSQGCCQEQPASCSKAPQLVRQANLTSFPYPLIILIYIYLYVLCWTRRSSKAEISGWRVFQTPGTCTADFIPRIPSICSMSFNELVNAFILQSFPFL